MTFRTTAVALLVMTILTLRGSSPAMAQTQTSDGESVSVELLQPPCGVDVVHAGGWFDAWEWNGSAWELATDPLPDLGSPRPVNTILIFADILNDPPGGCDVTVSFTGLSNANGTIPPEDPWFLAHSSWSGAWENSGGWSHDAVTEPRILLTYRLMAVPPAVPAGLYSGIITVSVTNTI